jgi:hypothetical protein
MRAETLTILNNPAVAQRVSNATRRVLEERAKPVADAPRFLSPELYGVLQQVVHTLLPQGAIGTRVDLAAAIDKRLADGTSGGWRFAALPSDGEAYVLGLTVLASLPEDVRKGYLSSVSDLDVNGFALSKWLLVLKTDVVKAWLSHPDAMEAINYYGFAEGATGTTDGPTETEGWHTITPNEALPFEHGDVLKGSAA